MIREQEKSNTMATLNDALSCDRQLLVLLYHSEEIDMLTIFNLPIQRVLPKSNELEDEGQTRRPIILILYVPGTRGWQNDTIYHTGIPNSISYYTRYRQ